MAPKENFKYKQLSHTLEENPPKPPKRTVISNKVEEFIAPVVGDAIVIKGGIQVLSSEPAVKSAIQALSNVPIIENAIQVLDQISDLGKSMPFVAPAFVLLKFIIEVEKRARDADVKCNDLLERITFMLSHLPALKDVQVIKPTQMVIERMNSILKDAASLIAAYRKQGAVARRLSLHNRDKFVASVSAINACSNDIMISLQIHQTTRLDVLTRDIPADPEDEAVREFIARHGHFDDVKNNQELVSEFAKEQHLGMDEEVMKQLNMNITDTMQQTMGRLETMLAGNINSAIVDSLKELAAEMTTVETQPHFICVQCEKDYTATSNGPQSCSYHRAEYSSWSRNYPCCGTSNPCQYQSHRATHHCDYPYGLFFPYSRRILGYVDTVKTWVSVEDTNLENNGVQKASAGRLLRWASKASLITEPTIIIRVGTLWHDQPYYFHTFTAEDLESVADAIRLTGKTVIFRTSSNASEFAMAEWIISATNKVFGIRLTAQAATSNSPYIRVCLIDAATCTLSGDVLTLSEGGFTSYMPATPYVVPDTVRVSPTISDVSLRLPRTDFKTHTSPSLCVILKTMSDPPLSANVDFARRESDIFQGEVAVFNNHPAASSYSVTIASATASFRLVGDEDYTPVKEFKILGTSQLPHTIDPRHSWLLKFQVVIPRTEEDSKLQLLWFNRALVARDRPLRLKLVLRDIESEECFIVLEYVFNPWPFDKAKDNDLGFFYIDDPARVERHQIRVTKPEYDTDTHVLDLHGTKLEQKRLEKITYQAIKTEETEIDLEINRNEDGVWEWNAWALVDLSCHRVYAFKILIKEGNLVNKKRFACLGYVLCPSYGDTSKGSRPVRYALEKVKLPKLEPYTIQLFPSDDKLDDFVPEPLVQERPMSSTAASVGTSGHLVVSENLDRRLSSIDSNLSRIAEALERLVDIGSRKM